nr:MAG TPA: hypothetical protein [Caudoviricetes sp.]DAU41456.1 MAG TPA: hypothetical protein [Bacteriophage sp.]
MNILRGLLHFIRLILKLISDFLISYCIYTIIR